MKVKLWSSSGFATSDREEVIEVDDDATDDEINEYLKDWFWNYHEYGFEKLDGDK